MSPQKIQLVEQAWSRIEPQTEAIGMAFYDQLFRLDPRLRPLFRGGERRAQARKLMQMLGTAIELLKHPAELLPTLELLGRRHAGYGVRNEHYLSLGLALMTTLEQQLGDGFDAAQRDAWISFYGLVGRAMQHAAARHHQEQRQAA